MLDRMGYDSQEILPTVKTIVDRFKSWGFFSLERDCVQVSAVRVLCLLSCSRVQIQPPWFTERCVLTVTHWILRAKFADSSMGITPINLATKICYKEEQLRCKSLFGLYLRWRFCKQNLVHNSSDNRQVRVEICLLSAVHIPSTALADMKSNSKNIVRKFSRSCSEGKAEMRDGGEDYESHVSNNASSKWRKKQLCNREKSENNQTCTKYSCPTNIFYFSVYLKIWELRKVIKKLWKCTCQNSIRNILWWSTCFDQNLREAHPQRKLVPNTLQILNDKSFLGSSGPLNHRILTHQNKAVVCCKQRASCLFPNRFCFTD